MMDRLLKVIILAVGVIITPFLNGQSCGPQKVTITDYCPDQYAEFVIDDTDNNTKYDTHTHTNEL